MHLIRVRAMRTVGAQAMAVEEQAVFDQGKAESLGDHPLPPFNFLIAEFLDPSAVQAPDMVMMFALIEFKH